VSDRFEEIRSAITANDERIVETVNERLRLVAELWELKRQRGDDRVDPRRETELREVLSASNGGPLSAAGLDELVTALLALTKRELS
jgi:chorismate mutase